MDVVKVRISYTVEVNDDIRQQINAHYGRDGLATRDEVRRWYQSFGESMDDDLAAGWVGNEENYD